MGLRSLTAPDPAIEQSDLSPWVRDALTHYWGGPKLTENPLLNLQIVQQTARQTEESPANALRAILRKAIDYVRPEGERRFTGEWILYNILDMKFLEGRKVREIACVWPSRKPICTANSGSRSRPLQKAILEMEQQARLEVTLETEPVAISEAQAAYNAALQSADTRPARDRQAWSVDAENNGVKNHKHNNHKTHREVS